VRAILAKKHNNKGFTLMEMLIVVAILVVLLAVAVPLFSSQLNSAKKAVDDANLRMAKQIAQAMYLLKQEDFNTTMYFDKENETFVSEAPSPGYGQSSDHLGEVIYATWDGTKIALEWTDE